MIIEGDSLIELKKLETDSIDFICTDPPYGYSFMGKHWDKAVPSVELWAECLRVLKPGSFINVMSAPRSDVLSRMIVNIEDAGFRVDFTPIYWTYASGFPKAGNIGKLVDKRLGAEREIISSTTRKRSDMRGKDNYLRHDKADITTHTTKASSDQAKALDGSYAGFQPKPAVEVIIVAMKPLSEKTFVDQALKNGKGISWLDNARIPFDSDKDMKDAVWTAKSSAEGWGLSKDADVLPPSPQGRFPANLLVSDDVLNDGVERKTGNVQPYNRQNKEAVFAFGAGSPTIHIGDSGSYSRYFDLDKWAQTLPFLIVPKASKSEKNKGLESFNKTTVGDGRPIPIDNAFQRGKTERVNSHPTVKPLKLMSYLITLFSREGDVVLDPFVGSGTTCVAAKNLNREYIGIERETEYVEIAEARLLEKQASLL